MSSWFLRRWDPFETDWSLYRHFEEIDKVMDKSFRKLEHQMEKSRQRLLEEIQSQEKKPKITPESTSYLKE
jgi:uncharacterized membrane-anchored protein YhcB (DUF1043 family)